MLCGSDADLPAQLLGVSAENGCEDVREHPIGLASIARHPGPHRREPVREAAGLAAPLAESAGEPSVRGGEPVGRRVVGRCEPAIARPRHAREAGRRAPAADPQRDARAGRGCQLEVGRDAIEVRAPGRRFALEQRPEQRDRLVESLPALLERDAEGVVVARGRARPECGDEPTAGEQVDRRERLGELNRATKDGERHRRRKCHVARPLDHARERSRPVEPRRLEDEVIVRADSAEAALPRRVDRALKACE